MRTAVAPLIGTEAGRQAVGAGAGGDTTVEIDRLAEQVALEQFERVRTAGRRFSVLSEEVGAVDFGAEYPRVVMDPIDGSLNAKQGVPCFSVMLSLLDGPNVASVRAGYTLNLTNGEDWHAVRGGGAFHRGRPLTPLPCRRRDGIEIVALESSPRSVFDAERLIRRAGKLRILGSMAISLVQAAAGSFDVFCSPMRARVFDMTAGVLALEEVGGRVTDMAGRSIDGLSVGFDVRTTLLAAADPAAHALALEILGGD